MQLLRNIYNIPGGLAGTVITIGNFDGIHLAHQALIKQAVNLARQQQLSSVVILFEPQPNEFFQKNKAPARLMRLREKAQMLAQLGVDYLLVLRFDRQLAAMSAEDFVSELLINKLKVKEIIIGDDFRFGAKRQGDFALLQAMGERYGFQVEAANEVMLENQRVSSTLVRQSLAAGDLTQAAALLGHPYFVTGRVAHGDKQGREYGFPTANIYLHRQVVPLTGIYAVKVEGLDLPYFGSAYVGMRPTVNGSRVVLEVYLFDFNQDIYGCYLKVEFLHKMRDDKKFESIEQMVQAIKQDVANTRAWLKQRS